jgi:hypothetical protein
MTACNIEGQQSFGKASVMKRNKYSGLARFLLLLLLAQHAVLSIAMPDGSEMFAPDSTTTDMTMHGCGGEFTASHHEANQSQHDHQQCLDSGCSDCVVVTTIALSDNASAAIFLPVLMPEQQLGQPRISRESDALYRPPI